MGLQFRVYSFQYYDSFSFCKNFECLSFDYLYFFLGVMKMLIGLPSGTKTKFPLLEFILMLFTA